MIVVYSAMKIKIIKKSVSKPLLSHTPELLPPKFTPQTPHNNLFLTCQLTNKTLGIIINFLNIDDFLILLRYDLF
jgi:hypothetical protein